MKPIKLLLSISLAVITSCLSAQTTFLDSSVYYTLSSAPSLSDGHSFTHYIKEFITLDSTTNSGEYYSIIFSSDFNFKTRYSIKYKDEKVYFSGKLRNEDQDSFEVRDLMIYDFMLNIGDTLKIQHSASGLNIKLLIDSVKTVPFKDGKSRLTQYYTVLLGNSSEYYSSKISFASNGMGSDFGLLPFKIKHRNTPYWQNLISLCQKDKNMVYSNNERYDIWGVSDYCDETEIIAMVDEIRKLNIDNQPYNSVQVFPNPIRNELHIEGFESIGKYKIFDITGQIQQSGDLTQVIYTEKLNSGFYFIVIEQSDKQYHGTFLKE